MRFSIPSGAVVVLLSALLAVGCNETVVDDAKTEDLIEQNVERTAGTKVESVDCPSGVDVERGARFECTVSLVGGEEKTARMKVLNEDADLELADLQPAK